MILNPLKKITVKSEKVEEMFDKKDDEKLAMICDNCGWSERCGAHGDPYEDRWCLWWYIKARKVPLEERAGIVPRSKIERIDGAETK